MCVIGVDGDGEAGHDDGAAGSHLRDPPLVGSRGAGAACAAQLVPQAQCHRRPYRLRRRVPRLCQPGGAHNCP
eukprot:1183055-Prorocentrum_minimum.AAC.1